MELCIDRLTKQYGHKLAVDRVDLELSPGCVWAARSQRSGEDDTDADAL